ncbi:hypothetical protein PJL18_04393 [Paenarthrobacter nicotinovorans]|nr:hypothetical protein [Paenarthrobacter nicotinovorans]
MRGAVWLHSHNIRDDSGVQLDAKPGGDLLAFRRVVEQDSRGSGRCGGGSQVGSLGTHEVVIEVVRRRPVDRRGAVGTQGGGDVVGQLTGERDGGLPQRAGDGQELQAALLESGSRVVNENKCICHGWSPL